MKAYTATITHKGLFIASLVIPHDGIHKGARDRANQKAQAWKNQGGYRGKITITTEYDWADLSGLLPPE